MRAAMGCGWIAPSADARPWQHQGDNWEGPDEDKPAYSTCPGYTTGLPDVVDAVRSWIHWDKGQLIPVALAGREPSDALIEAIETFAETVGSFREWKLSNPEKA